MNELREKLETYKFNCQLKKIIKKYRNKKVILYGTGKLFNEVIKNYNLSNLNIIAISDKKFRDSNYEIPKQYRCFRTIPPNEIHLLKPDIVFLTTEISFYVERYFCEELFKETGKKFKYENIFKLPLFAKINEEWETPILV